MEGMFSFDATPMAPIGTEYMVHVKPSQRLTWGYHAIKAWYFCPALNHYRCIKVVTDTRAVRTTDTFKFLHDTLPVPEITPTDRVIKATNHLKQAIDNHTTPFPDELEAIATLKALITSTPPDPPLPEPPEHPPHDIVETVKHYDDEPVSLPLHSTVMPPHSPPQNQPTTILFHDDELDDASGVSTNDIVPPNRYNLRSQAQHIIQSALVVGLVIPKDHIAFAVIDEKTGQALEHIHLIKMDAHKDTWSTSYANELGRLTQGIRDIPGTNTMFFIHKSNTPEDRQKDITYGRIVVARRPQ